MNPHEQWMRVNRAMPCPVCGRTTWCLIAADKTVCICPRTESPKLCGGAGYFHRLDVQPAPMPSRRRVLQVSERPLPDFSALAGSYQAAAAGRLNDLAASLGVCRESLAAFGVGWSADHTAWSFPMTDPATRKVTGIRLRRPGGSKFSERGGKEALFLPVESGSPTPAASAGPFLILEGATDAIAAHSIGYRNVAGRPSCSGGVQHLIWLVRTLKPTTTVVVADADGPGVRGAEGLAPWLALYSRDVRVIAPPTGVKDMRDWARGGATRSDLERLIGATPPRPLTVTAIKRSET